MGADKDLVYGHISQATWHFQRAIAIVAQHRSVTYAVRYCLILFDRCLAEAAERSKGTKQGAKR